MKDKQIRVIKQTCKCMIASFLQRRARAEETGEGMIRDREVS